MIGDETDEPMSLADTILAIIAVSPQPLGWYGIERYLGMDGVIPEEPTPRVLDALVQEGFLVHEEADGYRHGVYRLTERGRERVGGR
jgi:DNA-binding PadR family transcriptional regulator